MVSLSFCYNFTKLILNFYFIEIWRLTVLCTDSFSDDRIDADIFFQDCVESICVFSPDLYIIYANRRLASLWTQPAGLLAGQNLSRFIDNNTLQLILELINQLSVQNPFIEYEHREFDSQGRLYWQRWRLRGKYHGNILQHIQAVVCDITREKQLQAVLQRRQEDPNQQLRAQSDQLREIFDRCGNKIGAIESLRDISYQKKIQMELLQSQTSFKRLADTAPAIIYVLSGSRILYVNRPFEYSSDYSDQVIIEKDVWDFIHPDDRDWVREMSLARQRGEDVPTRYQARLLRSDGNIMWADISTALIDFDNEPAILGVIIDISDRKEAEEKILYLSYHDRLTNLYNRSFAEEKIKELDDGKNLPLSMIIGDVNGLKLVNDAFGHQEGDNLLRMAAEILSSCCRDEDILARWGGDEFVILLPGSSEERTLAVCENISRACNDLGGFPVQVSISLGMATKNHAQESIEQISKEAEDRMYRNKLLESKSNRSSFLYSLEKTLWIRSHETQVHTERLRQLVGIVAEALHLQPEEVNSLTLLAALHDIGKIAIPNSILEKQDKLDQEEWNIMKKHPEIGYRIALSSPELAPIAEAILAHHERWDGSGYPLGLKEREIPLVARILALADAYDVMLSGRAYRQALSQEEALQEIATCAGTQFDPDLARLFICLVKGEHISPRMRDIF